MSSFEKFKLRKPLQKSLAEMGLEKPTPIQSKAYPAILSGRDLIGLAQTGTGKTLAYLLPLLQQLEFSDQIHPRILILVPTRELVEQVSSVAQALSKRQNARVLGIYGGTNINSQKNLVVEGSDLIVATPGRLFDLAASGVLRLNSIQKLVVDEIDEMFFEGFRPQLMNILDLLPKRRQNIMFSATLPEEVEDLVMNHFLKPKKIEIVPQGTPLDRIEQKAIPIVNYKTKVNFLSDHLMRSSLDRVLIFAGNKKIANRLFEDLEAVGLDQLDVIHSNKSQNYRFNALESFRSGQTKFLIATDVVGRGIDVAKIDQVINFDLPKQSAQYLHRIGRTGRAMESGQSLLLFSPREEEQFLELEIMMNMEIPLAAMSEDIEISKQLMPEEKEYTKEKEIQGKGKETQNVGEAFHEKKEKNKKVNLGGSYKRTIKAKYKKPKKRPPKSRGKR